LILEPSVMGAIRKNKWIKSSSYPVVL